jgi:predicted neutral ceramidase superfamily lipid hydrolase
VVSAAILGIAGFTALAALLIVPAMIVWNAVRYPNISRFYPAMFLVLWACVSVVHAGVWFLIVVAAHSVNSSDLYFWIAANAIYPVVGAVFVWVHRWMARRSMSN